MGEKKRLLYIINIDSNLLKIDQYISLEDKTYPGLRVYGLR